MMYLIKCWSVLIMSTYYMFPNINWGCGGLAVVWWTAKSEVQIPARADIWIEISVPCTPLSASGITSQWIPEPVPSLELAQREEERVERMIARTSVIKKKHERNPKTQ